MPVGTSPGYWDDLLPKWHRIPKKGKTMESFLSDTAASLTAAALVAAAVWLANFLRNRRLEAVLADSLPTNGVGILYDQEYRVKEFTVQVSNQSSAMIRVRALEIITDSFPISFVPRGALATSQNPLSNASRLEEFPRRVLMRGSLPDDEIPGSMLLPPLCLGIWKAQEGTMGKREVAVSHAYIVFEYPNLLGQSTLVRIKLEGKRFALVKERVEEANNNAFHGVVDPVIANFRDTVRG